MTPLAQNQKIRIELDGTLITAKISGQDVHNGQLLLDKSRLYELIQLDNVQEHIIRLEFETSDIQVFAFTFG